MIGIRDEDGRFWSAPGLTYEEAWVTWNRRRWGPTWSRVCRVEEIPDDCPEAIAMLADFEADSPAKESSSC